MDIIFFSLWEKAKFSKEYTRFLADDARDDFLLRHVDQAIQIKMMAELGYGATVPIIERFLIAHYGASAHLCRPENVSELLDQAKRLNTVYYRDDRTKLLYLSDFAKNGVLSFAYRLA
ncbi:hypothetical protein SARC_05723 [Sphaeroforma arctica JP610]|uniref:Uncharacterized protein n=1 Tax=Sphaeroforma arctica JP610 TaxID=667725 RepID=A0A0L0FZD6_9EUKA|nr:hypothetical protein SARC_05723 [Sphaeroforma arctica JP610]KNC81994.1 hypothetical protein SARC_05723 [Sphaeroforma arctica JP610]|eukprot:XP_014155896.1 hypothetical protein SARC_05723 [Sphaeroforma arctica JP610]